MSVNIPPGFPYFIYDSPEIVEAFLERKMGPEFCRNNETIRTALEKREVPQKFIQGVHGLGLYFAITGYGSTPVSFDGHFNPQMKYDSDYFNDLNKLFTCVERNAETATTPEEQ